MRVPHLPHLKHRHPPMVYAVTDAPRPMSADIDSRRRRYLISMGIRTACVPLVVVLPSPWRWIVAAGAIFIPYVAVIFANGGREPDNSARFEPYEGRQEQATGSADNPEATGVPGHSPEIRS